MGDGVELEDLSELVVVEVRASVSSDAAYRAYIAGCGDGSLSHYCSEEVVEFGCDLG